MIDEENWEMKGNNGGMAFGFGQKLHRARLNGHWRWDSDIFLLYCRYVFSSNNKVFGLFSIFVWTGTVVAVATASKKCERREGINCV
jgi:hypothetical protein